MVPASPDGTNDIGPDAVQVLTMPPQGGKYNNTEAWIPDQQAPLARCAASAGMSRDHLVKNENAPGRINPKNPSA